MKSIMFATVLAPAIAIMPAGWAHACSCVKLTAAQMAAETPVLFEGELVAIRRLDEHHQVTTFRVVRPIKGVSGQTVEIESGVVSAACGYTFEGDFKGKLIGAERDARGVLTTNRCKMMLLNQ
jgi:hypothetical protein